MDDIEHHDQHSGLQNLLRRLGAGLEDVFPIGAMGGIGSGSSARIKSIITNIRSKDEDSQVSGLTELCEYISISTEDALISFPTDQVVPLLIGFLGAEHNPNLMLLAAQALTFLADIFPPACASIIRHGAVPAFCTRLLNIEYIDLAEQSLQALEKLSHRHPGSLLRAGALTAVLLHIDFFQTGVQRVAAATAANICQGITEDHMEEVSDAAPILINLLSYHDAKIVDSACLALTRIAKAFSSSATKMAMLCNLGLVDAIVGMVKVSDNGSIASSLSSSTFYGMINLLATCADGSPIVAEALLKAGMSSTLRTLLETSPLLNTSTTRSGNALQSIEQMQDLINLASHLLPELTDLDYFFKCQANSNWEEKIRGDIVAVKEDEESSSTYFLKENSEAVKKVASDLIAIVLRMHNSIASPTVKSKSLKFMIQILYFTPTEHLELLVLDLPISNLISYLLRSQDVEEAATGMQMATIVLSKLPHIFRKKFIKEGATSVLEDLASKVSSEQKEINVKEQQFDVSQKRGSRNKKTKEKLNQGKSETLIKDQIQSKDKQRILGLYAQHFLKEYFTDDSGDLITCETDGIRDLRDISSRLPSKDAVAQLISKISGDVSTFEIVKSGAISSLRSYLECSDISIPSHTSEEDLERVLLQRLGEFISICLPLGSGAEAPMLGLLTKIQGVLENSEHFKIHTISMKRTTPSFAEVFGSMYSNYGITRSKNNDSLAAALNSLNKPVRVRFCRAENEDTLKQYEREPILIEPLATMQQIERFLWPRVQMDISGKSETNLQPCDKRKGIWNTESSSNGSQSKAKGRSIPPSNKRITRAQARAAAINFEREESLSVKNSETESKLETGCSSICGHSNELSRKEKAKSLDYDVENIAQNNGEYEFDMDFYDEDEAGLSENGESSLEEEDEFSDEDLDPFFGSVMRIHDMHLNEELEGRLPVEQLEGPRQENNHTNEKKQETQDGKKTYARAIVSNTNQAPKIQFLMEDMPLKPSTTVLQAIQCAVASKNYEEQSGVVDSTGVWNDVHTFSYRFYSDSNSSKCRVGGSDEDIQDNTSNNKETSGSNSVDRVTKNSAVTELVRPVAILKFGSEVLEEESEACRNSLVVLSILELLNRLAPQIVSTLESKAGRMKQIDAPPPGHVPREFFLNERLSSKTSQQLKSYLTIFANALPEWCNLLVHHAHFLLPFEVRRRYFYCTAFGISRALIFLKQEQAIESGGSLSRERDVVSSLSTGRISRQKVRISRNKILESAYRMFEDYAGANSILEVEFFNEAGSGLGPTLEFYTLLSHQLQKASLSMWRKSSLGQSDTGIGASEQLDQQRNLSSAISSPNSPGPVSGEFSLLSHGQEKDLSAQKGGMQNCNLPTEFIDGMDLVDAPQGLFPSPLNKKDSEKVKEITQNFNLLGRVMAKALQDFRLLDIPLNNWFYKLAMKNPIGLYDIKYIDQDLGRSIERLHAASCKYHGTGEPVLIDSCPIADLCLTFVYPGDEKIELCEGGADISVHSENLDQYIAALVDATVGSGVSLQFEAFRAGFEAIFPLDHLSSFYEDEIEAMLCGSGEKWTIDKLSTVIKFDHGYTRSSPPVIALLEVLAELETVDQRRFLRFVTGSPRLPAGGLAALQPRLTVVRKLTASIMKENDLSEPEGGTSFHSSSFQFSEGGSFSVGSVGMGAKSSADGDLPSVMTCANYLKLPPYSSKEVLKERLMFAIREGQGSFDLS